MTEDKAQNIIHLIQQSALDQTIKDILIRDLQSEGLTDLLKEQIKAYCLENIQMFDKKIMAAKKLLEEKHGSKNPA